MFLIHHQVILSPGLEEDRAREFYRCVPVGETRDDRIGLTELLFTLRRQYGDFWTAEQRNRYFAELKKRSLVKAVQGGGVYRLPRNQDTFSEKNLYEPMKHEIETGWAKAAGHNYGGEHDFCEVVDTSEGGRRRDGAWRRPDLTLVGGREIPYIPGNFVDIVTFEIKKDIPLVGVYEALAHQRAANYSYVVYWFPEIWGKPDAEATAEIEAEARRCGVGVIVARQEDDYGCWDEIVHPRRIDTDPQLLENFLKNQCQPILNDLLEWINRKEVVHPPIKGPPTDEDFKKLTLSEKEKDIARAMYDELRNGNKGWTHFRRSLGSPLDDSVIRRVRNAMRDMGFIRTSQGGGLYIRHSRD